ncbi:MAG: alpha/beta hydrolase [Pseudomonadota bacterium]
MKTIIDGHTVHRHENPGAPTLVLTRLAARDGGVWDGLWTRLATHHQLIAVDLKRPSTAGDTPAAVLKAYADALVAVTEAFETGPVHLVGWTGGSQIALQVAVHHPAALASMTLVTPFREAGERRRIEDGLAFIRAILAAQDATLYARYWFTAGLSDRFLDENMDAVDQLVAARVAGDPFIGFDIDEAMDWMAALRRDHVDDATLSALACPTLIVAAGQNRWHAGPSPQMAQALHERLPNSTLRLVAEAGPLVLIEAADTVAPWIADFVAAHEGRPRGEEIVA